MFAASINSALGRAGLLLMLLVAGGAAALETDESGSLARGVEAGRFEPELAKGIKIGRGIGAEQVDPFNNVRFERRRRGGRMFAHLALHGHCFRSRSLLGNRYIA